MLTAKAPIRVYISIGSNVDPHHHIRAAHKQLFKLLERALISPIYQSPAVGMIGPDFLNAVVSGNTTLSVTALLNKLSELELVSGRIREDKNKFSDRTLDLDLLLFGEMVCSTTENNNLTLPHPEILEQAYVLQPLVDLDPDLMHPVKAVSMAELLTQLQHTSPEIFSTLRQIDLQ